MTNSLRFRLPDGSTVETPVTVVLNAGFAGRDQDEVAGHIAEMAALGIPAPRITPVMYPVGPYLAQQTDEVNVQYGRKTSGEAEWALVITGPDDRDVLLTVACDHTDRDLEVHSIPWSKNSSPDVLGKKAWRLVDIGDHLDEIRLRAWVGRGAGDANELIQDGTLGNLLSPSYWIDVLRERRLANPGTVLLSGTILMLPGVDQFADAWKVTLSDPVTEDEITCSYRVSVLPEPIG